MRRFISLRCATRNECFRFAGHTYEFLSTRSVIMKLTIDISGWAEMLWIWINVSVILFLCLRSGRLRLSKGMVVVVRNDYKWEGIFFLNELVYCMNWHHSSLFSTEQISLRIEWQMFCFSVSEGTAVIIFSTLYLSLGIYCSDSFLFILFWDKFCVYLKLLCEKYTNNSFG